jgi:ribonuclease HI/DNA polymerase-3 subunit epsilon
LYPGEDREWIIVGGEEETTNNRMELTAVIEALGFVDKECIIYTDSQWTLKCAKGEWKRKVNLDLWKKFDEVSEGKTIDWNWVKAHNGDEYNELVDKLAREEAKNIKNMKI